MATITDYQKQYNDAKARGDTVGMNAAHAGAEAIRAQSGYSGGVDGSKVIPLTPAQTAVSLGVNTAVSKTGSSKKKTTTPTTTPVQAPQVAPAPTPQAPAIKPIDQTNTTANADLINLVKQYLDTQKTNQQSLATARAGLTGQLNNTLSPENYNAILEKVLAMNMPSYNTQKAELEKMYAQRGETVNADAEGRGIYNSGIANTLVAQNEDAKAAAIAKALAEVNATSAAQAKDAVSQQLQALGLQGDWLSSDASLTSDDVKNAIAALLNTGGLNNDTQKIANDYNLGITNANIDQAKVNNDYTLGLDQNAINRTKVNNDYTLGQAQTAIDQQNADTALKNANTQQTQVANNYDLGKQQIQLDQQNLTERARQFDLSRSDDMDKFAQTMGLNWAQLGAQERASMAEAGYRNAMLNLETKKFNSEQELIQAQRQKDELGASMDAYKMLQTAMDSVKAGNGSMDDLYTLIKPYQSINSSLYNDLKSTIDNSKKSLTKPVTSPGTAYEVKYKDAYKYSPTDTSVTRPANSGSNIGVVTTDGRPGYIYKPMP